MKLQKAAALFATSLLTAGLASCNSSDGPSLDKVDLAQELAIMQYNDQMMAYANFKALDGMVETNFKLPDGASITANGALMTYRPDDIEWSYARALSQNEETVEFVYTRNAEHKYTNTLSIKSLLPIYPAYPWKEYTVGKTYYYSYVEGILPNPDISPEDFFGGGSGKDDPNSTKVQDLSAVEVVRAVNGGGQVYTATCNRLNRTFVFPTAMPEGKYTVCFYAYYEKADLEQKEGVAAGKRMLQRLITYPDIQIKKAE